MKPTWIIAGLIAALLLFLSIGLAVPGQPKAAPTFTIAGLSLDGDVLIVRFKPSFPDGTAGTWDPEAAKAGVARLVTVEGGNWLWTVYRPELRDTTPPPPPPPMVLIESFEVKPSTIKRGESATLAWSCPKAKTVTINAVAVPSVGSQTVSPPATATYNLVASDGGKTETAARILTVQDTPPPPPPIPEVGLRVLIIEEKTERGKLSAGQIEILTSTAAGGVLDYLAKNCIKAAGVAEWRLADKDASFELETGLWQNARAKFKTLEVPVPGWLVSNGREGIAGPLPATPAEALVILKKHTPAGKGN